MHACELMRLATVLIDPVTRPTGSGQRVWSLALAYRCTHGNPALLTYRTIEQTAQVPPGPTTLFQASRKPNLTFPTQQHMPGSPK